jgi:lysophospholipase L1-like esterase
MTLPDTNPCVSQASGRRVTSPRRRLLFVFLVVLVVGVLQEVVYRLAFPFPEVMNFNRNNYVNVFLSDARAEEARRDGSRNMILRADSDPDGYSFNHTLNLYGFRGPTFALSPSKDRPRVVFVGDSFVEGMGAADGDTIPAQFGAMVGGARKVEVINLGVSGTGLREYTRLVRDSLHVLHPASVFVVIYANDLPAPPYPSELDEPAPADVRLDPIVPRVVQIIRRLSRGLVVPRFFHSGPFPYYEAVPSNHNPLTGRKTPDHVDPAVLAAMREGRANPALVVTVQLLEERLRHDFRSGGDSAPYWERMATLCRAGQARLIMVYIPYCAAVNPAYVASQRRLGAHALGGMDSLQDARYRSQQRHLRHLADTLGIPFLDLTDTFVHVEQSDQRLFWPVDGHCNAAGYRLVAEACARYWTTGALPRIDPPE